MEQRLLALEKVLSEPIESLQEANVGLTADLLCFLDKSDVASQRPAGSMCLMASKPPTLRLWRFLFASRVSTSDIRYHFAVEIPLHQKRFAHALKDSLSISIICRIFVYCASTYIIAIFIRILPITYIYHIMHI